MLQTPTTSIDPHQLLRETDTAELICQSVRTLQKWRVAGQGPSFYKIGRSIRYRRREIIEWIDSRRRTSTSQ